MKLWLKALISLGLLAVLFAVLPWSSISTAAGRLPLHLWLVVVCCFVLGHVVGIVKWRLMVNVTRAGLRRLDAIRCYSAGLFANLCLPSIVGGDVLRATLAARRSRRPEAVVLGSLADRLIDVAALCLLVIGGALLARNLMPEWAGVLLLGAVLLGAIVGAASLPLVLRRPLASWPSRWRRLIGRSLAAFRRLARNPGVALIVGLLALGIQGGFVLLNALIGQSIGIDVPLGVWFLVWPLAKIAGLMPMSLGGLGVRDATLGALLVPFGVPMAYGLVASLIWQTVVIAGGLIAGATWFLLERTRRPVVDSQRAAKPQGEYV